VIVVGVVLSGIAGGLIAMSVFWRERILRLNNATLSGRRGSSAGLSRTAEIGQMLPVVICSILLLDAQVGAPNARIKSIKRGR